MHREEGGRQVAPSAGVQSAGGVRGREGEAEEVDGERKRGEQAQHGEKKKASEPGTQQARRREVARLE